MTRRGLAVSVFAWTVACGGSTAGPSVDASARDTGAQDTSAGSQEAAAESGNRDAGVDASVIDSGDVVDAGQLSCGDAQCDPSQICLYPACGCARGSGQCMPPSCVSPAPGMGSYDCTGGEAGPACSTVSAPIPSACSKVCHAICA
jgi:hypothetical protein